MSEIVGTVVDWFVGLLLTSYGFKVFHLAFFAAIGGSLGAELEGLWVGQKFSWIEIVS